MPSKVWCDTGLVYEQRLGWRNPQGQVLVVPRFTVLLDQPTRDGDTEIHLLSNLPVRGATAIQVAKLYRRRWTIEGLFLEMAQTLDCEINTLCYPKAALFAFCLGLLASQCRGLAQGSAAGRARRVGGARKSVGLLLGVGDPADV